MERAPNTAGGSGSPRARQLQRIVAHVNVSTHDVNEVVPGKATCQPALLAFLFGHGNRCRLLVIGEFVCT